MPSIDQIIVPLVGFSLTMLVFSYLLGDNAAYRLAVNFLAGLSLTYAVVVVLVNVLWPRLVIPILQVFSQPGGDYIGLALSATGALFFGALILMKLSRRLAPLGNYGMAVLIGVGAGLAVGGALVGSLIGLSVAGAAWWRPGDWAGSLLGLLALVAMVTVLISFWYSGAAEGTGADRRPALVRITAGVGRAFLMVTFGALFGGALVTGIATLVNRLELITQFIEAITR
jgi:hypothetical protein